MLTYVVEVEHEDGTETVEGRFDTQREAEAFAREQILLAAAVWVSADDGYLNTVPLVCYSHFCGTVVREEV